MRDFLIYNEADFENGKLIGSEMDAGNLVNSFRRLNDGSFNAAVFTAWNDTVYNDKFVDKMIFSDEDDSIILSVENNDIQHSIQTENFCRLHTDLYDEDGVPTGVENLTLNFSWNSAEIQHEEEVVIKLTGFDEENEEESSYQEIHINNKAEMMIKSFHHEEGENIEYITDTAAGSIRPINDHISNYIDEGFLDFRVQQDNIYTRYRARGSYSEWYEYPFEGKISEIEFIQPANPLNTNRVYKELTVNEILVDGYNSGPIYRTDVFDAMETSSLFNEIEIEGLSAVDTLFGSETRSNIVEIYIHYGNTIEEMKEQFITITEELESGVFSINEDLEEIAGEKPEGRYAQVVIRNLSSYYQNSVDHIILNHTPKSMLKKIGRQVDEYIIEDADFSRQNVIEAETENFPFKIVVPEDAGGPESVDIKRCQQGELFAEGMFGFEFDPVPELDRYILIEVDYTGYDFNPYMSEEGLLIGYVDMNGNPQQLETVTFSTRNKVLAYYL